MTATTPDQGETSAGRFAVVMLVILLLVAGMAFLQGWFEKDAGGIDRGIERAWKTPVLLAIAVGPSAWLLGRNSTRWRPMIAYALFMAFVFAFMHGVGALWMGDPSDALSDALGKGAVGAVVGAMLGYLVETGRLNELIRTVTSPQAQTPRAVAMAFRRSLPVLRVSDSAAAVAFYCDKLGFGRDFAFRVDETRPDPCYLGLSRDGVTLHVSSFPGDGVFGSIAHFLVDDVDALHTEFVAAGVPIALPPTDQTWGDREMHVLDPDGNCLRFATVDDP